MSRHARTALRSAWAQSLIDDLGPGFLSKFYDGTQPADTQTALSGNTLLGTLVADATPGSVANGLLTWDQANFTQNNATHVNGTPTWVSLCKADGTRVYEFATSGDGMTFNGTIANGVDIARTAWTWAAPEA